MISYVFPKKQSKLENNVTILFHSWSVLVHSLSLLVHPWSMAGLGRQEVYHRCHWKQGVTGAGRQIDRSGDTTWETWKFHLKFCHLPISFQRLDFIENAIDPGTAAPHINEQPLSLFLMLGRSSFIWQCRICTDS